MAINRTALKNYAPQARLDFIQAITNRAAQFGITTNGISKGELQGELFIVEGKSFPRAVSNQREKLVERINQTSFEQVMDAVAYTWFNRFLAIRYMELHGYFDHGYRVLSHPQGHKEPEILEEAAHLDLPGLKRDLIVEMKLIGTQDEALYRKILIAQCNDLYRAMPFLFEKIEDETELLLPENLLQSDSIVRKLAGAIDETEWNNIEIIGWLYQFYISDKKEQVIGKVVESEDIPAATQLFTPNWIVKYMVQNSLGSTWLGTYPHSSIKKSMAYYIDNADQNSGYLAELSEITPKSLDPEALTLIDPAVGSGHILSEAYDLFKEIYIERGYTAKEAARLILTKNLFGLDIDDRAAQMAGFALLMKARADDRSLLRNPPKLNIHALQESNGLDTEAIIEALGCEARVQLLSTDDPVPEAIAQPTLAMAPNKSNGTAAAIRLLLQTFKNAKTFGSLITIEPDLMASLHLIEASLDKPASIDLLNRNSRHEAVELIRTFVNQAKALGGSYKCVVANPPYMGRQFQNAQIRQYLSEKFPIFANDIYAAFVGRSLLWKEETGTKFGLMTPFTWLSKANYEDMRRYLISNVFLSSLIQPEYHAFFEHAFVPICTFCFSSLGVPSTSIFIDLGEFPGADQQGAKALEGIREPNQGWVYKLDIRGFEAIPSASFTFAFSSQMLKAFGEKERIGTRAKKGVTTGDNEIFMRRWQEISVSSFSPMAGTKWFPITKGGDYRKWYGNFEYAVDWEDNGYKIRNFIDEKGKLKSRPQNLQYLFHEGITWNDVTVSDFTGRYVPDGFAFSAAGPMIFHDNWRYCLGMLNSRVNVAFLRALCPTMKFEVGAVSQVPVGSGPLREAETLVSRAVEISKSDWNSYENSWEFERSPFLDPRQKGITLNIAYETVRKFWRELTDELRELEQANNQIFIELYELGDQLTSEANLSDITLNCNPSYRFRGASGAVELEARLKSESMRELISYAVGCMMGRYSLVELGLIYAHAGNVGFDSSRYGTFPADVDGILPVTEQEWFEDDAANRLEEFLSVAWPNSSPSENLAFLIDGLIKGRSREPRADLRAYFAKKFYIDHLQTYKNRPIYWLFSSGKEKAFECLVYLHRYNEGTLARMRTEYVTPLMGKMQARIEALDNEIIQSSSSAEKSRKNKDVTKLRKQLEELRAFDEELRHLADQRIPLDLDDGVKVNYGKFGNLLAAKDRVCGKRDDAD